MAERVLQGPPGLDPEIAVVKSDVMSPAKSRTAALSLYPRVV